MSAIVSVKSLKEDSVQVTFEMDLNEYEDLKGNMFDLNIFSESNSHGLTRLVSRGKRESSKYFLVPRNYRKHFKISNEIPYQILETKYKFHIIYTINKF